MWTGITPCSGMNFEDYFHFSKWGNWDWNSFESTWMLKTALYTWLKSIASFSYFQRFMHSGILSPASHCTSHTAFCSKDPRNRLLAAGQTSHSRALTSSSMSGAYENICIWIVTRKACIQMKHILPSSARNRSLTYLDILTFSALYGMHFMVWSWVWMLSSPPLIMVLWKTASFNSTLSAVVFTGLLWRFLEWLELSISLRIYS